MLYRNAKDIIVKCLYEDTVWGVCITQTTLSENWISLGFDGPHVNATMTTPNTDTHHCHTQTHAQCPSPIPSRNNKDRTPLTCSIGLILQLMLHQLFVSKPSCSTSSRHTDAADAESQPARKAGTMVNSLCSPRFCCKAFSSGQPVRLIWTM